MTGRALPIALCSGGGRGTAIRRSAQHRSLRYITPPLFPPAGGVRPMVGSRRSRRENLRLVMTSFGGDTVVRASRWRGGGSGGPAGKRQASPGLRDLHADRHQRPSIRPDEGGHARGQGDDCGRAGEEWPGSSAVAAATVPGPGTAIRDRSNRSAGYAAGQTIIGVRGVLIPAQERVVSPWCRRARRCRSETRLRFQG